MNPDLDVHELSQCPACGHSGLPMPMDVGEHSLLRCEECQLVFASRYADPSQVYVDGYLFGKTSFGLDVRHPRFQELLAHAAEVRLRLIEKVVGGPSSLLDIGCGSGEVLAVAQSRGWSVTGVEPVEDSAHFAQERGLNVIPTLLEESGLPERSYDVVSAFHVLEHMTDGKAFLRLLARWSRPGGYIVIEVPNWRSFHRRNAGASWSGLRPLEHVAHYQPSTLDSAFREAGLEPLHTDTPGFLWKKQTLPHQLDDLGLYRWRDSLPWLGRHAELEGRDVIMPRAVTAVALRALQATYKRLGVGQVVLAVARVP